MSLLTQWISQYSGLLRSFKGVYVLNNWVNRQKLKHNKSLYKQYGLRKSIYSNIGSHELKEVEGEVPWLDRKGAMESLKAHPDYAQLDEALQAQLQQFVEDGYMILKGFYSEEEVDRLNGEVDRLLKEKRANFNYTGRKVMDAFRLSPLIDQQYFRNSRMLQLLQFVMGQAIVPFQTINFIRGSEQRAHSDSIHMTTAPEGYMIATWTALEDMHQGNGPIVYYPGSHRLPYLTCEDYPSGNSKWRIGSHSNKRYEDRVEALIKEHQLKPAYFLGKKGDVLIWHANLLHGGSKINREGASRRSMVAHYFCKGVICYHEMSQRPALLEQ